MCQCKIVLLAAISNTTLSRQVVVYKWEMQRQWIRSGRKFLRSVKFRKKIRTTRYSGRFECAQPWGISMQLQLQQPVNALANCALRLTYNDRFYSLRSPNIFTRRIRFTRIRILRMCSSYTDSWVNPRSVRRCNFVRRSWIRWIYSVK